MLIQRSTVLEDRPPGTFGVNRGLEIWDLYLIANAVPVHLERDCAVSFPERETCTRT